MMTRILKTAAALMTVATLTLSAAPVFAEGGTGTSGTSGRDATRVSTETEQQAEVATETEHSATTNNTQAQEAKQQAQAQHQEKVCTTKRRVVSNVLNRISERGQKQIGVFDKIAQHTEDFAANNKLTVANYDTLVSTVNAKKTAAQGTVNKIKADASAASSMSCDPGQPKAVVEGFKADQKAENSALKDYKIAIKNLIVAVKSSKSSTEAQ